MSAFKYFFGVVARPQTWLDYVYLWLAFPLGLFYFIFLVVGLSVGLSLVIVWVGIPMLLLVAGAWYLFAGLERILARELLRAPVAQAPRAWEAADGVWNKLKAHFGSASTWKDLVFLLARLPIGIVSFIIVTTQAGLAVAFIGAPFFERFDALWIGDQRIDSPGVALALVPLGVLIVIALFHVVHGWAWVCGKLATALFGDGRVAPPSAQAAPPGWSPQGPPEWAPAPQGPQAAQYPQASPDPRYPAPQYPQAPQSPQGAQAPQYPQQPWAAAPQAPQYPPAQPAPGLRYKQAPHHPPAQPYLPAQPYVPAQPFPQAPQPPQAAPGATLAPHAQAAPPSPAGPAPATTAEIASPGEPPAETATPGEPAAPTPGAQATAVPATDAPTPGAPTPDAPTPDAPTRQ